MPDLDKFQSNNERNRSTFKEARQKRLCLLGLFIPYNTSDLMKWFSIIAPRKNSFRKDINSINNKYLVLPTNPVFFLFLNLVFMNNKALMLSVIF